MFWSSCERVRSHISCLKQKMPFHETLVFNHPGITEKKTFFQRRSPDDFPTPVQEGRCGARDGGGWRLLSFLFARRCFEGIRTKEKRKLPPFGSRKAFAVFCVISRRLFYVCLRVFSCQRYLVSDSLLYHISHYITQKLSSMIHLRVFLVSLSWCRTL